MLAIILHYMTHSLDRHYRHYSWSFESEISLVFGAVGSDIHIQLVASLDPFYWGACSFTENTN